MFLYAINIREISTVWSWYQQYWFRKESPKILSPKQCTKSTSTTSTEYNCLSWRKPIFRAENIEKFNNIIISTKENYTVIDSDRFWATLIQNTITVTHVNFTPRIKQWIDIFIFAEIALIRICFPPAFRRSKTWLGTI